VNRRKQFWGSWVQAAKYRCDNQSAESGTLGIGHAELSPAGKKHVSAAKVLLPEQQARVKEQLDIRLGTPEGPLCGDRLGKLDVGGCHPYRARSHFCAQIIFRNPCISARRTR
jgi:hypothetical protein